MKIIQHGNSRNDRVAMTYEVDAHVNLLNERNVLLPREIEVERRGQRSVIWRSRQRWSSCGQWRGSTNNLPIKATRLRVNFTQQLHHVPVNRRPLHFSWRPRQAQKQRKKCKVPWTNPSKFKAVHRLKRKNQHNPCTPALELTHWSRRCRWWTCFLVGSACSSSGCHHSK